MKRVPLIFLAALGVLAVVFARAYSAVTALSSVRTGDPNLDRFVGPLSRHLMVRLRTAARAEHMRACLSIISNESGGRAPPVIGDRTLGGGPSIGPMQVYRSTAKDLGLWTPPLGADVEAERAAYADLAYDESTGVAWGVAVFCAKLRAAEGDVQDAIRRYNGGGAAAAEYRDRALAFAARTWGGLA